MRNEKREKNPLSTLIWACYWFGFQEYAVPNGLRTGILRYLWPLFPYKQFEICCEVVVVSCCSRSRSSDSPLLSPHFSGLSSQRVLWKILCKMIFRKRHRCLVSQICSFFWRLEHHKPSSSIRSERRQTSHRPASHSATYTKRSKLAEYKSKICVSLFISFFFYFSVNCSFLELSDLSVYLANNQKKYYILA